MFIPAQDGLQSHPVLNNIPDGTFIFGLVLTAGGNTLLEHLELRAVKCEMNFIIYADLHSTLKTREQSWEKFKAAEKN